MTLLYAQIGREAQAWRTPPGENHPVVHHVKDAGFAGLTGHSPGAMAEMHEDDLISHNPHDEGDPWGDDYDDDVRDESTQDPTPEEDAHQEEHGEYPESYDERNDAAYEKAFHEKRKQELPDHHDDDLMNFVSRHSTEPIHWHDKGTYGPVDISGPVHATQSHVSQKHLDKYHADPDAQTDSMDKRRPEQHGSISDYPGDKAPMFVTHQGRLNTIEGHHRVAAALQRGDSHINAFHYDADKHGFPQDEEDDEDW